MSAASGSATPLTPPAPDFLDLLNVNLIAVQDFRQEVMPLLLGHVGEVFSAAVHVTFRDEVLLQDLADPAAVVVPLFLLCLQLHLQNDRFCRDPAAGVRCQIVSGDEHPCVRFVNAGISVFFGLELDDLLRVVPFARFLEPVLVELEMIVERQYRQHDLQQPRRGVGEGMSAIRDADGESAGESMIKYRIEYRLNTD